MLYVQQTDVLNQKIYDLRLRRTKLINEDEDEKCIERMRELRKVINDTDYLTSMDEKYMIQLSILFLWNRMEH